MKKALIYSLSLALLLSLTACHKPQADQQDTSQQNPAAVSTPADISTPEPEPTTPEPATTPEPEKITTPEPEPEQTPPAPVETEETQPTEPVQQPKPTTKPTSANPDPDTGEITYINPNQVDDGSTGLTTGIETSDPSKLTEGIDPNQNPWDVQGEMYYGGQQEDQSGGTGTQTQQTSKPSSGGKDIYDGHSTYEEYIQEKCNKFPNKTREELERIFPDQATGHTDEAAVNASAAAGLFNH